MVVVAAGGAELHKLVPQHVMLESVPSVGRLPRLEAAPHMFADAQPSVREVVVPLVTVDEKSVSAFKLYHSSFSSKEIMCTNVSQQMLLQYYFILK